jgi:hypothetical protein
METPNAPSLSHRLSGLGADEPTLLRIYRTFNATAEPFRKEGDRHGK